MRGGATPRSLAYILSTSRPAPRNAPSGPVCSLESDCRGECTRPIGDSSWSVLSGPGMKSDAIQMIAVPAQGDVQGSFAELMLMPRGDESSAVSPRKIRRQSNPAGGDEMQMPCDARDGPPPTVYCGCAAYVWCMACNAPCRLHCVPDGRDHVRHAEEQPHRSSAQGARRTGGSSRCAAGRTAGRCARCGRRLQRLPRPPPPPLGRPVPHG